MTIGVKLFHSSKNLRNYVLVKPSEDKAYLYRLENDGRIRRNAKPVMTKTYTEDNIIREAFFPYCDDVKQWEDCYTRWYSKMPRLDRVPRYRGVYRPFTIENKDGLTKEVLKVNGFIDSRNKLSEFDTVTFPHLGFDQRGFTNLARLYLKKIGQFLLKIPMNKNTHYVSPEHRKILNELDKECGVPKFEITDEMRKSAEKLAQKHNLIV